jgi:type I site-specific restriction endonuclease
LPAVQLGLTATPKRKDNVDTYAYFGEPVYLYSLKEGVNDGFLTPFKVKRIIFEFLILIYQISNCRRMNLSGTENNGFIIWVGFIHKKLHTQYCFNASRESNY